MDLLIGLAVFALAWRWLSSRRLPHNWTLGGAVFIAAVLYPVLTSMIVAIIRTLALIPFWTVIPVVLVLMAVGWTGYWLGSHTSLFDDRVR